MFLKVTAAWQMEDSSFSVQFPRTSSTSRLCPSDFFFLFLQTYWVHSYFLMNSVLLSILNYCYLLWSLHVLLMFAWVSSGCSCLPHRKKSKNELVWWLYLQSAPLTKVLAHNLEFFPRALRCGCPLLLRDGLNAETKSHCSCTCDK